MVLLPVFVLVGFTFVLLLMAGRRQGAVMARETKIKDTALGQFELPRDGSIIIASAYRIRCPSAQASR